MRTMILITASILVLTTACSALTGYTPAPLPPMERTASIKPVDDIAIEQNVSLNCDSVFRNQLIWQRGASTKDRMNVVIAQIQSQQQECNAEVWDPTVVDLSTTGPVGNCYGTTGTVVEIDASQPGRVGEQATPPELLIQSGDSEHTRSKSGRDSENNIIVYFNLDVSKRPSDGANCWFYYSRLKQWHKNFYTVTVEEESSRANLPTVPTQPAPTLPAPTLPDPTRPHIPSTQEIHGGTQTPPTSTPVHSPTAKDLIPEWAYENHPSLTEYILNLPWASGKLTAFEINTIELLIRYGEHHSNGIEYADNENLLAEPDPFAIDIIQEFRSYESAPEVTDPRQIKVERRLINLPLRGQTNLLILREQPGSEVTMNLLESSVRSAERFMNIPFPTDQVTFRFTKSNVQEGYAGSFTPGTFSGGQVQILPRYDQNALVTTHYSPGNEKTPGGDNCPRGGTLLLAPLRQLDR